MNGKEWMERVFDDLDERGLMVGSFIAVNPETGMLTYIAYDAKGLVKDIGQPVKAITCYGKDSAATRAMHEIITIEGLQRQVITTAELTVEEEAE